MYNKSLNDWDAAQTRSTRAAFRRVEVDFICRRQSTQHHGSPNQGMATSSATTTPDEPMIERGLEQLELE